jgi:RimJ/RimL family protein N-acetyltransferase
VQNSSFFQTVYSFKNDIAELKPLSLAHAEQLADIAFEEKIWLYGTTILRDEDELIDHVDEAIAQRRACLSYPFAVFDRRVEKIAGCTRLFNFSWKDERCEIGHSWLGSEFRGTGLNRAVKFELLKFAFEIIGMQRVELKTDARNKWSRKAMKKIGATEEGTLRSHSLNWDNYRRDTVYFSVLKKEWPTLMETVFSDLALSNTP